MRRELTDALIRTLRADEDQRLEIWDTRCEGLVVRVSDKGRVTFHARARGPDGRKHFAGLGVWPALSLSAARTEARLSIGRMQKGADPSAERRAARVQRLRAAALPSLRELGLAWAKAHQRDTSPRYRAELLSAVSRGCGDRLRRPRAEAGAGPNLMERRVDAITIDDIAAAALAGRTRGDGEARHLVRALRRLFGFALASGHVESNPVDAWMRRERAGRRSIPWMRDGIREHVLSDAELAKIWTASESLDVVGRVFTRLMVLTACRTGEIAGLSWREVGPGIDETGKLGFVALALRADRTKNRRPHKVPLGELAAAELAMLAPNLDDGKLRAALVLPGMTSRTAATCRALRKRSGVDQWTWHDLRRTAATGMARLGCPREHVEASLNHITSRGGLVGIYQRYDYDAEARQALLRWQAHVAALVAAVATADVVLCGD